METWFVLLVTISLTLLLKSTTSLLFSNKHQQKPHKKLPPGPIAFPIIGTIILLKKSFTDIEPTLRSLHAKFGPVVTLHAGSCPAIFVADHSLAYKALVQNGAVFADRPPGSATAIIINSNQHNVNSAAYGPTWRTLRRNLTSEILHPSRVRLYSHARKWVLDILMNRLESQEGAQVQVVDDFQYAMFCLLVLMCFGDKLGEEQIKDIERSQRNLLLGISKFNVLNFWPRVTKIFMKKKWDELLRMKKEREDVLVPLIRARKKLREGSVFSGKLSVEEVKNNEEGENHVVSYVDTLLELELPEEKRKMNEDEIVSCCSEFLNAGTDTTSTALQWIMANLVKYPQIQEKLFMEIKGALGEDRVGQEVKEEDLQKMPYLKAIILEGLRRHPPGHFLLPHAVTEDVVLDKYVVPKNGSINFMVAEMARDPSVWKDPMAFKPERFLNGDGDQVEFDITGSREIKMMPFGAGRRICPGYTLAILHLEYFVANLVWKFEWKKADGEKDVDLTEKVLFTVVMKDPLQACISRRFK